MTFTNKHNELFSGDNDFIDSNYELWHIINVK